MTAHNRVTCSEHVTCMLSAKQEFDCSAEVLQTTTEKMTTNRAEQHQQPLAAVGSKWREWTCSDFKQTCQFLLESVIGQIKLET